MKFKGAAEAAKDIFVPLHNLKLNIGSGLTVSAALPGLFPALISTGGSLRFTPGYFLAGPPGLLLHSRRRA